jgi:hypothetical protein
MVTQLSMQQAEPKHAKGTCRQQLPPVDHKLQRQLAQVRKRHRVTLGVTRYVFDLDTFNNIHPASCCQQLARDSMCQLLQLEPFASPDRLRGAQDKAGESENQSTVGTCADLAGGRTHSRCG